MDEIEKKLGLFLSTFNEIEAQSYIILKLLPDDELREYALNIDQFKPRVRYLQALLKNSNIENKDKYHNLFNKALALSTYRNQLSHNPIRINIYENIKTSELITKTEIENSKNGGSIPQVIEQLDTKLREVSEIFTELFKLTSEFTIVN